MTRASRVLGALVLAVLFLALFAAPSARAHVKLASSDPAAGASLTEPPERLTLRFSSDVSDSFESVTVTDPDGTDVAGTPRADGTTVTVAITPRVTGTYAVRWRTLGADGHPISGDFRFATVGTGPAHAEHDTPEVEAGPHAGHATADTYPRETLHRVNSVARFAYYLSLLVIVGGALFATIIAPGWRPRYFRRSALVLLVSSLLIFGINLALAGERDLWGVINPVHAVPHMTTPVGRTAALSALLAVYLLRSYPRLKRAATRGDAAARRPIAIAALLLALVPALGGHATASDYWLLRVPLDMVHLLAAGIWFGGIVQLQGVSRPYLARHPAVYPAVVRYSKVAFIAVVALVATGLFAAWAEIGMSLADVVGTTYGRLVLAKAGLLALTMPLAYANRARNVPAMVDQSRTASVNLRRFVMMEIAILLLVTAATTWLVYEMPPREVGAATSDHAGHQM